VAAVRAYPARQYELSYRSGFAQPCNLSSLLCAESVVLPLRTLEKLQALARLIGYEGEILSTVYLPAGGADFSLDDLPQAKGASR
jgi:hypothetical protein